MASPYFCTRALLNNLAPRPYVPEAELMLREALYVSAERQYLKVADSLREG